ncbi:MAG: L,D-transpeptidase family protein [Phycisphaerae bacterium]
MRTLSVLLFVALMLATQAQAQTTEPEIALQAALDRAGFSPGIIDGKIGRKTQIAIHAYQTWSGLRETGELDDKTRAALNLASVPATVRYNVTASDLDDVGGPIPEDWNKRAALTRARYESNLAMIAERGHASKATIERLNPSVNFERLKTGDAIVVPNVWPSRLDIDVSSIEVDLEEKVIRVRDAGGKVNMLLHCSIAAFAEKRPRGDAAVKVVVQNPEYTFRPEMWPEVKNVDHVLQIMPGPRNPVGLCWIGLDLPGYGIHGTPWPELIGKTGSHGCIRLANWDAVRLGQRTKVGTSVSFVGN